MLYNESICHKRWHRSYLLKNHRIFTPAVDTHQVDIDCSNSVGTSKVYVAKNEKILTAGDKRKKASFVMDSILNLLTLSSNSNFNYKLDVLKKIEELWRNGHEVQVNSVDLLNYQVDEQSSMVIATNTTPINIAPLVPLISNDKSDNSTDTNKKINILQHYKISDGNVLDMGKDFNKSEKNENITEANENKFNMEKEIESIIMPTPIKRKGNCKDSLKTVIGLLKKRKTTIPKAFENKTLSEKQHQILSMFVENDECINLVMSGEYLITAIDLKKLEDIPVTVTDECVFLDVIKDLVTNTAYESILNICKIKSKIPWDCLQCKLEIGTLKSIQCSSCLHWYHFHCMALKSVPYKKHFFCFGCTSK